MDADVIVIGAGIVGLATARALQQRLPGLTLVVVDKERSPALHQTGRNSGVVHSGLYYAPGSAKAQLVADGRRRLADACAEWGVPIDWCGKVVVATSAQQLGALDALERRGRANGVDVERVSLQRLAELEPHVAGLAALHVRSAGIVDYRSVATAMAEELTSRGAALRFDSAVEAIDAHVDRGVSVRTSTGPISASWVVNCAGLHSDRIARLAGADTGVRIVPFRGEYHELVPAARGLVRNLVYPVPDPRWPFLGVHATRMTDGSVHIGPNAVLALGRESYRREVDLGDTVSMMRDPALRRLARRYWRTGAEELLRSRSLRLLLRDVQELLPEVTLTDLEPSTAGIRAQALAPDGRLLDDFAFADSVRAVHVLNAPSPAATASLAIGDTVAGRLVASMRRS